ncbi:hypothetical protein HN014_04465 [Aquimarina sp. TRL1]|uniref:tyrosine-type recombinase/integrase n=1 Tax=Aquimarina sp. (strain TRL1) TaxID=2736252 RepID=UPI001589B57D|nr:hypothetical protein [Aquimarina sp. TRL1]QKX04192.1 hypothetical protein HN014_04465 [Aquimarina sp. TRL1]
MNRRKKLPLQKHEGLCIYCNECQKHYFWTKKVKREKNGKTTKIEPQCGKSNSKFSNCQFFDKHRYKARLHVPGSKDSKVSKTFDVTQYADAVVETIKFKKKFLQDINTIEDNDSHNEKRSAYLFDAQLAYIDFLDNIGVPEHEKVQRSDSHIKEQMKCLTLFNEALSKNKVNKKVTPVHRITNIHVGYFHTYLLNDKNYKNKTYNNKMVSVKSFFGWAIENYNINQKNPFEKAKHRSVQTEKKTITEQEFKELISPKNMCKENGWVSINNKTAKRRNIYRDFLADGILLCLHTGGRREEVVELTWDMIHEIDGKIAFIELKNLKVERALGEGFNDNVNASIVPVTASLRNLLVRLGYYENKNTNNYLLCPDRSNISTRTIMDNLSKGFTHFYKRLKTDRELQLKCLRKTYLTHLNKALKGDAKKLSSHTTDAVLQKHYIDEKVISSAIAEMTIFGD